MMDRNTKALRKRRGLFTVLQPGEQAEAEDEKPVVGEKLKVRTILH